MVKHRYYLPGLIILSSLLGLFPTVVDIGKYGPVRLFIPTVGEGLLICTALFILCASCIKKSQSDGVIYLGWAVTFAVLLCGYHYFWWVVGLHANVLDLPLLDDF